MQIKPRIDKKDMPYKAMIGNCEVGFVTYSECGNIYDLTMFYVRDQHRRKGIGKILLAAVLDDAVNNHVDYIRVYPSSESFYGDPTIEPEILYEIYWHLGFRFKDHLEIKSFEEAKTMSWIKSKRECMILSL